MHASKYKLDLKQVFREMDVSGDGFVTVGEMSEGLFRMGVCLTTVILVFFIEKN